MPAGIPDQNDELIKEWMQARQEVVDLRAEIERLKGELTAAPNRVIRFRHGDQDLDLAAELARIRPACVVAAEQIQIAWGCHQRDDWEGFYAAMMLVIAAGNRMFQAAGADLTRPELPEPGTARLWVGQPEKPSDRHPG